MDVHFGVFFCFVILKQVRKSAEYFLAFCLAVLSQLLSSNCWFESLHPVHLLVFQNFHFLFVVFVFYVYLNFPQTFNTFLLTSWYKLVIFCILIDFSIFSCGCFIVIDDPVSITNSYLFPFLFIVAIVVYCSDCFYFFHVVNALIRLA